MCLFIDYHFRSPVISLFRPLLDCLVGRDDVMPYCFACLHDRLVQVRAFRNCRGLYEFYFDCCVLFKALSLYPARFALLSCVFWQFRV